MSILGYSSSYFLPKYWANTPFYGEKLIPLLDYILSTDYVHTEQLATAFYNIESKYKNTADLPIEQIEAIIEESGYGYIRELLGQDEDSIRLLVYLLVLIHQLKGSKKGIELVLSLLKSPEEGVKIEYVGNLEKRIGNEITGFSPNSYIAASNFNLGEDSFSLNFQIRTGDSFETEQCIASAPNYGFYLGIDTNGRIVLKIGEANSSITKRGWQVINGESTFKSDRVLERNTLYYINFEFSGYDYSVRVSQDGKKYTYYKVLNSSTPLGISNDVLFIGIDNSENTYRYPFLGYVYMNLMTVSSNDIKITQWFEKFPVGDENTFSIESGIDGEVISNEFFTNFAKFVKNYVYPTLESFRARLTLKGEITFIPYVREQVTYVASDKDMEKDWQDYLVTNDDGIPYRVVLPLKSTKNAIRKLYAYTTRVYYERRAVAFYPYRDEIVYLRDSDTLGEDHPYVSLYRNDGTLAWSYVGPLNSVTNPVLSSNWNILRWEGENSNSVKSIAFSEGVPPFYFERIPEFDIEVDSHENYQVQFWK